MDEQIKARKKWINLYLENKNVGYVCRHCGISWPNGIGVIQYGESDFKGQSRSL